MFAQTDEAKEGWQRGEHRLHGNTKDGNYIKFSDRIKKCLGDLPAGYKILDVGCGDGKLTHLLSQQYSDSHFSGVDISPVFIDQAKALNPKIEWHVVDVTTQLPFGDKSFDLIISHGVFQYIANDHLDLYFKEIARLLKPNGYSVQFGMCDKAKFFSWFTHPLSGPRAFVKFFTGPALKSYLSNRIWDDGTLWHKRSAVEEEARRYFNSCTFQDSECDYRSDLFLRGANSH